jgi:hypothetical protein
VRGPSTASLGSGSMNDIGEGSVFVVDGEERSPTGGEQPKGDLIEDVGTL